jgi:hypothetical protein
MMSDIGTSYKPRGREFAANKRAFTDVFGDPFALPEALTGHYQSFKSKGLLQAMKCNFDEGKATGNAARPNVIDFYCDVERIVHNELTKPEVERFIDIYLEETGDGGLSPEYRSELEQRIGRGLRRAGITSVRLYFSVRRSKRK